jgi:hypothetical protein
MRIGPRGSKEEHVPWVPGWADWAERGEEKDSRLAMQFLFFFF